MPGAKNIRAGGAYVEIGAKGSISPALEKAERRLRAFSESVNRIGNQVKTAGLSLAGIGTAIGAPLGVAGVQFAKFQSQLAAVSTILDEPTRFMAQYTDAVQNLARQFGQSTEIIAGGLYDLIGSGIDPAKAIDVLTVSLKASVGGLTDAHTAARAMINILNAFGLEADQAGRVSDILFAVVRDGVISYQELADTVGQVTSLSALAGLSMEEMGAAIASMTRQGLKGDIAVTALKNILTNILNPTAANAAAAKQYGIELGAAALKSKGLLGLLRSLEGLPPDVINRIFGDIRGFTGISALLSNVAGYQTILADVRNSAGQTDQAFQKMSQTAQFFFKRMTETVKNLGVWVGKALVEPFQKYGELILKTGGVAIDFVKTHQKLVQQLGLAAAALIGVGGVLIGLGATINVVGFAFAGLGNAVSLLLIPLGAIGLVGSGITLFFTTLAGAITFLISPLGAITATVVGLGAGLAYTSGVWDSLKSTWTDTIGSLVKLFADMKGTALEAFGGIADALKAGDIKLAMKILWTGLKLEWVQGVDFLKLKWLEFSSFVATKFTEAIHAVLKVWETAQFAFKSTFNQVVHSVNRGGISGNSILSKGWLLANFGIQSGANFLSGLFGGGYHAQSRINKQLGEQLQAVDQDNEYRAGVDRSAEVADQKALENNLKASLEGIEAAKNDALKRINDQKSQGGDALSADPKIKDLQKQLTDLTQTAHNESATRAISLLAKDFFQSRDEWLKELAFEPQSMSTSLGKYFQSATEWFMSQVPKSVADSAATGFSTGGTFSSVGLSGFGGTSFWQRTADATERTARGIEELNQKPGAVFQ